MHFNKLFICCIFYQVIEVDNTENGRVRINITILEEPNVSKVMNNQEVRQ